MTFAPPTLRELAALWVDHGGVNLGIVGDAGHQARGVSYHLGRDQLEQNAYSARTLRDRQGLSDAASAIDLGKVDGSFAGLRTFSKWLVASARANDAGTSDIREIIYSPDGKAVLRWDRERGYDSLPQPGEADDTHLRHSHVSWYRDAEARDHTIAFRPYWEGPMPRFVNANGYRADSGKRIHVVAGDKWNYLDGSPGGSISGPADLAVFGLADAHAGQYVVELHTGVPYADKIARDTLVLIQTARTPTDVGVAVTPPPAPPDPHTVIVTIDGQEKMRAVLP